MPIEVTPTELPGVLIIEPRRFGDERGLFCETYNRRDFAEAGIDAEFIQDNHAFSAEAGMGVKILVPTLAVIVVGGLGSLTGALVGALLIGATLTFGTVFVPDFASILMYALLVAVLLIRPAGLFAVRQ